MKEILAEHLFKMNNPKTVDIVFGNLPIKDFVVVLMWQQLKLLVS